MNIKAWSRPVEKTWREVEFGVGQININSFDVWLNNFHDTVTAVGDNMSSLAVAINGWLHHYFFLVWLMDMRVPYSIASWLAKVAPFWFISWCENLYLDELWEELGI